MTGESVTSDKPVIVYSADSQVLHVGDVLRNMLRGAVRSNYLAYRLVKRDIKSEYSKAAFGMVWDLLDPLIFAAIFYALMQLRVINTGEMGMPYATFVTFGVLLYATFVDAVLLPTRIFTRSKGQLQHVNVAPEAHILAVFYRILFNGTFRIAVMLGVALALGEYSLPGFAGFLAAYPIFVITSMSIGVLFAPFNAVYADLSRMTEILLRPLRYICPVMWILPVTESYGWLYTFNPPAVFIDNLRALATTGAFSNPGPLAAWASAGLVVFVLGWFVFHVSVPVLAERA